jgi:hypothetical protein
MLPLVEEAHNSHEPNTLRYASERVRISDGLVALPERFPLLLLIKRNQLAVPPREAKGRINR